MSASLIVFVTICYVGVSISEVVKGNYPMAIMFFGYTIANIGFILAVK